jgi:RNA polymerase sigma-70 factor (ECF subfamily)
MSDLFEPSESDLPRALRGSWHRFLETYEPLRSQLYRYCRHLTRSPWDAEDLAQDTMARAFATLGQMGEAPSNPRAWLMRVASNLWIDQLRRRRKEWAEAERERAALGEGGAGRERGAPGGEHTPDPMASREAAGTLIGQLSPQERAAVVLKDVFEFSLEEVAEALSTSVGAVKAALHRARGKLVEPTRGAQEGEGKATPAPAVIDAFCKAFNARDLDGLTALLLDTGVVEVVGATTLYGPDAARDTALTGMLFGSKRMATADVNGGMDPRFMQGVLPDSPRVEARRHRGDWVLLHWYAHRDGEAVRAVTRIEAGDADEEEHARVARVQNYFFTPDLVGEVCGELGVPWKANGYRWWLTCR